MSLINSLLSYVGITDVLDIAGTTVLIYYVLLLIRGTRAVQIHHGVTGARRTFGTCQACCI